MLLNYRKRNKADLQVAQQPKDICTDLHVVKIPTLPLTDVTSGHVRAVGCLAFVNPLMYTAL